MEQILTKTKKERESKRIRHKIPYQTRHRKDERTKTRKETINKRAINTKLGQVTAEASNIQITLTHRIPIAT